MAIRDWHPGQLGVLWVGGAGVEWACYALGLWEANLPTLPTGAAVIVVLLALINVAIPIALLIVTWKWFGSRPRPQDRK